MLKRLFAVVFLLGILVPCAAAQSAGRPAPVVVYPEDLVFENLCAPDIYDELYEQPSAMALAVALDDSQLAKLRIELLERGWDPGFDPNAVDADAKLAEAIGGFQAQFSLPVTGQPDATTLWMLSVPIE